MRWILHAASVGEMCLDIPRETGDMNLVVASLRRCGGANE